MHGLLPASMAAAETGRNPYNNIFVKLLASLMGAALIPLIIVVILDYHAAKKALTESAFRSLSAAASHTAGEFDAFFGSNLDAIGSKAKSPAVAEYLNMAARGQTTPAIKARVLQTLRQFAEKDSTHIHSYSLLDSSGRVLLDTRGTEHELDLSDKDFFLGAVKTGLPYVSPVEFSPEKNHPYLNFSSPVFNKAGKLAGVLRAKYNASILQFIIAKNNGIIGPESYAILFDETYLSLADGNNPSEIHKTAGRLSPGKAAELQQNRRLPQGKLEDISIDIPALTAGLSNVNAEHSFFNLPLPQTNGKTGGAAVVRMKSMPWLVTFLQPEDVYLAPIHSQANRIVYILFFVVTLTALFALIASGYLSGPIMKLTATAKKVAEGDLTAHVEVSAGDEMGTLANTFNMMTATLLARETNLAEEKERLAVTLRSIGDGVITTDVNGRIVLINKVAEEMTGWIQSEASGRPLEEVFRIIDKKSALPCENPFELVMKNAGTVGLAHHTVLLSKDNCRRMISDSGAPIRDSRSRIIGAVIVFRDETEHERMEKELLRAQKLDSVGVLAGGIAHDFNNILTAIIGNISMAKIFALPGKCADRLDEAEKAALRAKDLTQQLLTFSKGGSPIKTVTSVPQIIEESANFALRGSNVRCEFSMPPELWYAEIDQGQISQVIHNMALNAMQAMPGGGVIRISVENRESIPPTASTLAPGRYIAISITDMGLGIPKEHLDKIFDPYFTTKQQGSGLGLASCYSIISKHDGSISVESGLGLGTTFRIYLPATDKPRTIKTQNKQPLHQGKGLILVVDDDDLVRNIAGDLLSYLGYKVAFAEGGSEAIELYVKAINAGQPFDALLMDITIPGGMGGCEAIKKLLEIDPHVRAVVSSGYSNDPIMADHKTYGFCGVVAKPYIMDELGTAIEEAIKGKIA
jgi:PAS domain S-box-containing protein